MERDGVRTRAIRRLERKREFEQHLLVFAAVNTLLIVIWAASGAGYFWPIWPLAGWGIAVALHAWRTYGQSSIGEDDIRREIERMGHSDRTRGTTDRAAAREPEQPPGRA